MHRFFFSSSSSRFIQVVISVQTYESQILYKKNLKIIIIINKEKRNEEEPKKRIKYKEKDTTFVCLKVTAKRYV